MATIPEKSPRRPGRPSKEEEVRQALAEAGCDPTAIDPLRILASHCREPFDAADGQGRGVSSAYCGA